MMHGAECLGAKRHVRHAGVQSRSARQGEKGFWGPERKLGVVGLQEEGIGLKIGRVDGWMDRIQLFNCWTSPHWQNCEVQNPQFIRSARVIRATL